MIRKRLVLLCVVSSLMACNMNEQSKSASNTKTADSVKAPAQPPVDPKIAKLLVHFKDNVTFPLRMDSIYIDRVEKFDSLGANEVRMLAVQWYKDKTMDDDHNALNDFYKIDSLKANHKYAKYVDSLQPGDTKLSNAYGLQKVKLKDSTLLLIWAFSYSSYEADPVFGGTNVYGTVLNNNNIGITYLLAQLTSAADPPSGNEGLLTDSITNDGKLFYRQRSIQEDYDSMQGQVYQTFFEYDISHGKITPKATKDGGSWQIKLKE